MESLTPESMKSFLEGLLNRLPEDKKLRFGEYLRIRQQLIHSRNFDCFALAHFLVRKPYSLGKLNPNEWEWHNYKTKSGEDTWKIGDLAMNFFDYGNGRWDTKHASMYIGSNLFLGLNGIGGEIVIDSLEGLERRTGSNKTAKMIPKNPHQNPGVRVASILGNN